MVSLRTFPITNPVAVCRVVCARRTHAAVAAILPTTAVAKVVLAKRRVTQASAKVTTEVVPEASARAVTQVAKRSAPSARRSAPHYKREPLPSSLRLEGSTASVQPLRAKRSREPQAMLELVLEHPTTRRRKRASIGSNFDSQAEMEATMRPSAPFHPVF